MAKHFDELLMMISVHKIGAYIFFQNKEWELKGQQKRTTTAMSMPKGQERKMRATSNS